VVQLGVPPLVGHALPHMLQLFGSLRRFASHPLVMLPSQLSKPGLHVIEHAEPLQLGVPLFMLHAWPQPPQLPVEVVVFTSHPLPAMPSQSAYGGVQLPMAQVPFEHVAVAFGTLHTVPQAPQWFVSDCRFVSQPFAGLPSQSPKPGLHAIVQEPPLHDGVPLVALQGLPQAPQLAALVARFVSHPFIGLLSQSPNVPEQDEMTQEPVLQAAVAFGRLHAPPHTPQFIIVSRLVSHPLV
jgi:hypothetical protein